jgi:neutral ceramidase
MPLYATALALRDVVTETTVIMLDLDLLLLPFSLADAMREAIAALTGVPPSAVRVSATHGHSGPSLAPTWVAEGGELIAPYVAALPGMVAGAAWEALRAQRPARVSFGTGRSTLAVNRRLQTPEGRIVVGRNPAGFVDDAVRVLRFDDADERPLAALVHYACHPIIMAWENRLLTPDYPGPLRQTVEQVTGARCIFFQGCAGNVGPANVFTEGRTGDPRAYRWAGALLGAEAARVFLELEGAHRQPRLARVLESGAPLGVYDPGRLQEPDGTIGVAGEQVLLPVRPLPTPAEARVAAQTAQAELARLRQSGLPDTDVSVHAANVRAKHTAMRAEHARLTNGRPTMPLEVQAFRVGPVALLGAPMEVFGELGAAIGSASPFAWTAVSGYTNGSAGYLPTAEAFAEGGYEVETASPFAGEAGARFVEAASALLRSLAG